MPASTSSKMSVGTRSSRARIVLSASMTRDSSPPEATRASGRSSCPTLSDDAELDRFRARPDRRRAAERARRGSVRRSCRGRAAPRPRRARVARRPVARSVVSVARALAQRGRRRALALLERREDRAPPSPRGRAPAARRGPPPMTSASVGPYFFVSRNSRSRRRRTSSSRSGSSSTLASYSPSSRASASRL